MPSPALRLWYRHSAGSTESGNTMANRKITFKPHPMSGAEEGPVTFIEDDQPMDLAPVGQKLSADVEAGDVILLYPGGPFEVISNEEVVEE